MGPLLLAGLALAGSRAPYLQAATPTSMTVVWRTEAPTEGVVCWGSAQDALLERATTARGTDHAVRIEGRAPGSLTWYDAGEACAATARPDAWFRTPPDRGSRAPFRLWVVGDSGTGGPAQLAVRDAMTAFVGERLPDAFVHVGDMAYGDGTTEEFDLRFFQPYEGLMRHTVTWPAMGNHEGHTSSAVLQRGPYYEAMVLPARGEAGGLASGTEAFYSFDHGNLHVVVLDSYQHDRRAVGAMLRWLEQDLASTDQDWVIAAFHHPPYTRGSHDSDKEIGPIELRRHALPILEDAGVDLVLSGHSHIYERTALIQGAYATPTEGAVGHVIEHADALAKAADGAVYVVAGHGGQELSQKGTHPLLVEVDLHHGSCVVDVDGLALTLTNVRADGSVSDRFTLSRAPSLQLVRPRPGEVLPVDAEVDVAWTSHGVGSGRVHVELSVDGGQRWERVAADLPDVGHLRWRTPKAPAEQVMLRVQDASQADVVDVLDGTLRVAGPAPACGGCSAGGSAGSWVALLGWGATAGRRWRRRRTAR